MNISKENSIVFAIIVFLTMDCYMAQNFSWIPKNRIMQSEFE